MTTALEARWTREKELELAQLHGRYPRREIAEMLGRSEQAVKVKYTRMKLKPPTKWRNLLSCTRLAKALGLACPKSAMNMIDTGVIPTTTYWLGNKPVQAITVRRLRRWLADPLNWWCLDVDKITDRRFASVVKHAKRKWDDEWITTGQACELLFYTQQGLHKLRKRGRFPSARQRGVNWRFLRSEVEGVMPDCCNT